MLLYLVWWGKQGQLCIKVPGGLRGEMHSNRTGRLKREGLKPKKKLKQLSGLSHNATLIRLTAW